MFTSSIPNFIDAIDGPHSRRVNWGVRLGLVSHLFLLVGLGGALIEHAARYGPPHLGDTPHSFWIFAAVWFALCTPYAVWIKTISNQDFDNSLWTPTLLKLGAFLALSRLYFVQRMGSNDMLAGFHLGLDVFWMAILFGPRAAFAIAASYFAGLTSLWFLESREILEAHSSFLPLSSPENVELLSPLSKVGWTLVSALIYLWLLSLFFKHNSQSRDNLSALTQRLQRMLDEQEQTQAQLVRSESLASIGQLVAGVAHELNNPLASAYSLLQTSISTLEKSDSDWNDPTYRSELLDDLQFILREQNRASEIVRSLLELSRQTFENDELVNLRHMLEDALRVLQPSIKENDVEVEAKFLDGLPDFRANFAQMGQVAMNLIQNAIHAMNNIPNKKLVIGTYISGSEVGFYIEDNGPGITESIQHDIFKPFFTTKPVDQGTGLGLYICHEIVTKHGGRINCVPSPMGGARFSVSMSPQSIFLSIAGFTTPNTGPDDALAPLTSAERKSE